MSITTTTKSTVKTPNTTRPGSGGPGIPHVPPVKKQRSVTVWFAYFWLAIIILLATFAWVLPLAPYDAPVGSPRTPPKPGDLDLLLGTDKAGRSILARTIWGAQISLVVGTVAGLSGAFLGTVLGLIAGYYRKKVDWVITLVADVLLAFPVLILLLAITAIFSPSIPTLVIGLTVASIPTFMRLARASTMSWASREFVRAAKNMGAGDFRILTREILPNLLPTLSSFLPIVVAGLIVAEGSLSFLGLGVPPPTPSWGGMINGASEVLQRAPHIVFVPAIALFLTVFSLNQVGDHLRGKFDRSMQG